MFPYWLLFGVFAAGSLGYKLLPRDRQHSTPLFIVALVAVMLMIGLRYRVGGDWTQYIFIYESIRQLKLGEVLATGDPAYSVINSLSSWLDQGIWLVNLICAGIFVSGLYTLARRQPNPWLAVLVAVPYLVIVVAMGYTRQAAAIGFIMIAIGKLEDQQYGRVFLLLSMAVVFHKSAILILPLLAISITRHRLIISVVTALALVLLSTVFLGRFLELVVTNYIRSEMASQGAGVRISMNIVPAIIFLFAQKRLVLTESERLLWRNFSLAAIATLIGLAFLPSTFVDRIALYLVPLQVFVLARLPYAFSIQGRPNGQVLAAVLVYSAAVQSIWLIYATHSRYWVPYQMAVS